MDDITDGANLPMALMGFLKSLPPPPKLPTLRLGTKGKAAGTTISFTLAANRPTVARQVQSELNRPSKLERLDAEITRLTKERDELALPTYIFTDAPGPGHRVQGEVNLAIHVPGKTTVVIPGP
jgi:hypothetical protein